MQYSGNTGAFSTNQDLSSTFQVPDTVLGAEESKTNTIFVFKQFLI